uniref:Reverse transcriptase domain-containing protein n=1 Tax=Panagrellus redivivus TaxID=6233 RepID=A0A7E4V068_PANRE
MAVPANFTVAAHVLGSDNLWLYESDSDRTQIENIAQLPPIEECNMLEVLTRLQAVMNRAPRDLDELVLVNPGYIDMETVSAALDHVQETARSVKCICALHARLTAATTKVEKVPTDGHLIMVTLVDNHQEVHVLTKTRSCYHFVEKTSKPKNLDAEIRRLRLAFAKSKIVLVRRKHTFPTPSAIIPGVVFDGFVDFDSWNSLLAQGGLIEARTKQDGKLYKIRHVAGFSIGLSLVEPGQKYVELCKYGAKVPLSITLEKTYTAGSVRIEYDPQLAETNPGKIVRHAQVEYTMTADETRQPLKINIEISILGNGSPTAKLNAAGGRIEKAPFLWLNRSRSGFGNGYVVPMPVSGQLPPSLPGRPRGSNSSVPVPHLASRLPSSGESSLSSLTPPLPVAVRPIPNLVPRPPGLAPGVNDDFKVPNVNVDFIMFLADDLFSFAVKDKKTGDFTRRINVNGNYWTPMFMSFRDISNIRLGEAALQDLAVSPRRVIHGLMQIIGHRRIEDIQVQPDWGFTLAYNEEGEIVIEFETGDGARTMVVPMALSFHIAAALKEAKRSTNNTSPMTRVYFKTRLPPTKDLLEDIQKAARTANVAFVGIDTFHSAPEI